VRRFLALLFTFVLAAPLLGAAPSILGIPVLMVYPFTVSSTTELDADAGSRLAVVIATQISNLGGVTVKPAPPGAQRKDYLAIARSFSANYYIAGLMTPLGDGVSVVEQLVSTESGIVVYSNTAQIKTFNDVSGQGDILRAALLRHQSRNLGAYIAPPPPAVAATPQPQASEASQANLSKLFGRKKPAAKTAPSPKPNEVAVSNEIAGPSTPGPVSVAAASAATPAPATRTVAVATPKPTPAPTPAPTAAPKPLPAAVATPRPTPTPVAVAAIQPPSSGESNGVAIARVSGPDADRDAYVTQLITRAVTASGARAVDLTEEFSESGLRGNAAACSGVSAIVSGNLTTRSEVSFGQTQTTATLELFGLDCANGAHTVYHRTFQADAGGDYHLALERVVNAALGAYLHPPKRR
jgi:TolB-like protein